MDRRSFLALSMLGLGKLAFSGDCSPLMAKKPSKGKYSIVILGDTHFDAEPADIYHSNYNEKVEWLNRVQRAEFARNGEMWRERCPKLLKRASRLVTPDTRMVLQTGDLIQGDCGKGEVHRKMLDDVMNRFKQEMGGLPFVTVVGNHDIRGVDADKVYRQYMPERMSLELGRKIEKTTFSFTIGDDAFLVLDFNRPDDEELEKLLKATDGARHTFILVHGPLFPYDSSSCRWFFHGGAGEKDTEARRHFRALFARRNAICLCGHVHSTELADWYGDGGRITQMTMNSVWSSEKGKFYSVVSQGASQYGEGRKKTATSDSGEKLKDETPLFDEYRNGLKHYERSFSAGSYKLNVSKRHVTIDFYGGDSEEITKSFVLR